VLACTNIDTKLRGRMVVQDFDPAQCAGPIHDYQEHYY
jgi:hypothetical protein